MSAVSRKPVVPSPFNSPLPSHQPPPSHGEQRDEKLEHEDFFEGIPLISSESQQIASIFRTAYDKKLGNEALKDDVVNDIKQKVLISASAQQKSNLQHVIKNALENNNVMRSP